MAKSSKTVSFSLPGSASGPRPTALSPTPANAIPDNDSIRSTVSPAPDLVADILHVYQPNSDSEPIDSTLSKPIDSPCSPVERPPSRPSSEQGRASKPRKKGTSRKAVPSYVRLAQKAASCKDVRDRSPLFERTEGDRLSRKGSASIANNLREQTNHSTHEHVRSIKQDVSRLREHLLKVEEEVKNLNRGRSTLEISVQDARKALSVNQRSISTQQKKSSKGEEVRTL